ncbi:MAG: DUF2892 domain-containing protein [Candidatus Woesearchaeota archaeon]|nr:DUF2892 domain-containing protein [Candidatus Woesearchaeota archaeon]
MSKQNLNATDRVLRFALAFWWLGPWKLQFANEWLNWAVLVIGWIALVESFWGYCWLHEKLGLK